ncbi:MAG: hypothetical protein HY834_20045 [Devosia nanyangense]|uniref:Uncharacterized protein n=1 Tax=Devosia nanyangense TaxID=1228055 RepID=A0A933L6J4_9HYPH|nr:hypothetical protein [Devosia nanyangense]
MTISSKLSALAVVAVVTAGAIASPVLASGSTSFDSDYFIAQLRYDGIDVLSVDDATPGTFLATVRLADGRTVFQLFDKDSLVQIKR